MGDIKTRVTLEGEQQFRSAMTNAANAIKVLNAEQKLAKASFKQTGDAEKYAAQQSDILKQKITAQKAAVQAAQQAIKQLTDSGVSPASRQFQQWQTKLLNAQTALTNMETELQNVNSTMQQTSSEAENTGNALDSIGKKVSFDAVINGIGKVTDFLESAAQKAKQFAEEIINFTRNAASEADDLATTATTYNMSTQDVQRMRYTADIMDTSADAIMKSRSKLVKAMQDDSETFGEFSDYFSIYEKTSKGKVLRDWEDVFWDLGDALVRIQDEKGFEYVNNQATKLFGKGWEQLRPIFASDWASEDNYLGKAFTSAREYYEAVMSSWDVNSDETMKNLTKYDDSIQKLQNNLKTLEMTVAGELAPGFKEVTDFISDLVSEFNKYLESDEGKEKMKDLSDAIVKLFSGLKDVDFGQALEMAKGAIDSITKALEWLSQHGSEVIGIIGGLATAFGGLKIAEGVLTFMTMLASGKYLFSNGKITGYDPSGGTGSPSTGTGGDVAVPGGTGTGATEFKPNFWDRLASWTNGFNLNNAAVVGDWLSHESPLGTVIHGTESVGDWWERQKKEFQERVDSFAKDWEENALVKLFTDRNANQDAAERLPEGADWRPSYMKDQQPIPVETEPVAPSDAAKDVSEQIGTVPVTVQPVVNDLDWRPSYMKGHANGLSYVPFDGYKAILHKGERVIPAREVQSRSYNSNLYVESMYMNNGTDADGLASAMAAAQRRTMSSLGS